MFSIANDRGRMNNPSDETIDFLADVSAKKCYTTIELLRIAREGMVAEELHLLFDYVDLHHRVTSLLHKLRIASQSDLEQRHIHADVQLDSDLPWVVADLFALMAEEDQSPESLDGTPSGTSLLECIASVVSDLIGEDRNRFAASRSVMSAGAQSRAMVRAFRPSGPGVIHRLDDQYVGDVEIAVRQSKFSRNAVLVKLCIDQVERSLSSVFRSLLIL